MQLFSKDEEVPQEEKKQESKYEPKKENKLKFRKAVVESFRYSKSDPKKIEQIIVSVNNNGEMIKYNEKDHKDIKIKDEIDII